MNDLLQLGQHPDADQLNAFIEHTLPAHEREQTLAHLATCADCRQIVALSLPPIEATPIVEADPVAKPRFGGWFRGWRLAWIAAPVFAGLLVLAIYVQNASRGRRQIVSPSQVAQVEPPSQQGKVPFTKESAAEHQPSASGKHLEATSSPSRARKPSPSRYGADTSSSQVNDRNSVEPKALTPPGRSADSSAIAGGAMAGMASGRSAPPQQTTAPSRQVTAAASPAPKTFDTPSSSTPSPSTPSFSAKAPVPLVAPASNGRLASTTLPQASASAPTDKAQVFTARSAPARNGFVSTLAPLPSGQSIMSFAVTPHKLVVLDAQNSVFFSQDDGRHWKLVSPVWQGRAIAVARFAAGAASSPRANAFALGVPERFKPGGLTSAQVATEPDSVGSSLGGTVTDASGAVIPGAMVIVQEGRYAMTRVEKTDAGGHYLFSNLAPGSYRIDAQAPGFEKQSLLENLAPSQQAVRDVTLAAGQTSQTVTVDAESMQLETQSQTVTLGLAKAKSAVSAPSAKERAPLFVLTTEAGDRWTSSDGLTWTRE